MAATKGVEEMLAFTRAYLLIVAVLLVAVSNRAAVATGNDALVAGERQQLNDGNNLIYASFGDSRALTAGVEELIGNLEMGGGGAPSLLCIDVLTTTARDSMTKILTAQKQIESGSELRGVTTVLFENVEKLRGPKQLLNLDFLFRLPDKSFDLSGVVAILLFNTDVTPPNGLSTANAKDWREEVRLMWYAADDIVQFNVDAAIGRIHRGVFFSAPPSDLESDPDYTFANDAHHTETESTANKKVMESTCVALTASRHWKGKDFKRYLPLSSLDMAEVTRALKHFFVALKRRLLSVRIREAVSVIVVFNTVFFFTMQKRRVRT